jgi:DNA-binding protein H-NS
MASYQELLAQRAMLEKQIEEARQAELSEVIGRVRRLIAEYGLTAADLGFKMAGSMGMVAGKIRGPVAIKYRGPNGETWSGRGKQPNWLTRLETEQGRHRDEFLV